MFFNISKAVGNTTETMLKYQPCVNMKYYLWFWKRTVFSVYSLSFWWSRNVGLESIQRRYDGIGGMEIFGRTCLFTKVTCYWRLVIIVLKNNCLHFAACCGNAFHIIGLHEAVALNVFPGWIIYLIIVCYCLSPEGAIAVIFYTLVLKTTEFWKRYSF